MVISSVAWYAISKPAQALKRDSADLRGEPGQATDNPVAHKAESRKPGTTPFHGKLKAVDIAAGTIIIGERTIQVTSDTRIFKAGQPAALEDGVVGEEVGGAYQKTAEGALVATLVRFGPKPDQGTTRKEPGAKKE